MLNAGRWDTQVKEPTQWRDVALGGSATQAQFKTTGRDNEKDEKDPDDLRSNDNIFGSVDADSPLFFP